MLCSTPRKYYAKSTMQSLCQFIKNKELQSLVDAMCFCVSFLARCNFYSCFSGQEKSAEGNLFVSSCYAALRRKGGNELYYASLIPYF